MPKYNHSYELIDGDLYEHWTNKSGTDHTLVQVADGDDRDSDAGCRACGNPDYPDCKIYCSLYDD